MSGSADRLVVLNDRRSPPPASETRTARVRSDRLTRAEAAQYLGMSVSTLSRRHRQGRGPARIRDGGKVWYRLRDLDRYHDVHCLEDPWSSTRNAENEPTAPSASPRPGGSASSTAVETSGEARVSDIEARLRALVVASEQT